MLVEKIKDSKNYRGGKKKCQASGAQSLMVAKQMSKAVLSRHKIVFTLRMKRLKLGFAYVVNITFFRY